MEVPIYDEELMFRSGNNRRSYGTTAYENWLYMPRPEIRITSSSNDGDSSSYMALDEYDSINTTVSNQPDNYPDGLSYILDYSGRVYFVSSDGQPVNVDPADRVYCSYNVSLFSNQEINGALNKALQSINARPGTGKYQLVGDTPFWYAAALTDGALFYLYTRLLMSLNQREKRLLLMDSESGAFDVLGNIRGPR